MHTEEEQTPYHHSSSPQTADIHIAANGGYSSWERWPIPPLYASSSNRNENDQ
jgi:hypothetical protein